MNIGKWIWRSLLKLKREKKTQNPAILILQQSLIAHWYEKWYLFFLTNRPVVITDHECNIHFSLAVSRQDHGSMKTFLDFHKCIWLYFILLTVCVIELAIILNMWTMHCVPFIISRAGKKRQNGKLMGNVTFLAVFKKNLQPWLSDSFMLSIITWYIFISISLFHVEFFW